MKVLICIFVFTFCLSNAIDRPSMIEKCNREAELYGKGFESVQRKNLLCLAKAFKMIDSNGNMDKERIREYFQIPQSYYKEEWIDNCIAKDNTPEENFYETIKCMGNFGGMFV